MSNLEYYESLRQICEFLTENKQNSDFVLNCFYQQEANDFEEMSKAEGIFSLAQKFEIRMLLKTEQMNQIKAELTNFKNEKFKLKVAEFLQWIMLQLDPPEYYEQKYPSELKLYLSKVKRFESDMSVMAADVNIRFKMMSVAKNLPMA